METRQQAAWQPDWAVAPGEILAETLQERRMSQSELSDRLGRPLKTVNEIVKGKAAITAETAIQLERVLGISARFWTGLETSYRDSLARQAAERELQSEVEWLDDAPVADLVKHGLIARGSSKAATLANVLTFLGISSTTAFERRSANVAYRSSPAFRAFPKSVAAWLRWGEIVAAEIDARPYNVVRFREVLDAIRLLTRREPFEQIFKRAVAACLEAGVIVVVVPELKGANLRGAARWIGSTPVIQLSVRHKADDQFWFTFFHEAGHVLTGARRRDFIDHFDAGNVAIDDLEDEQAADEFARNTLLPAAAYNAFVTAGDFGRDAVRKFARDQQIAPGVVVGRLQRDRHIAPGQHRNLIRRIALSGSY